jgi:hypothetical protein
MFFKTSTVYKVYTTQKGAERFIARVLPNDPNARVEAMGGNFYVVSH